jgi:rhodanese-related sulfurtransferase
LSPVRIAKAQEVNANVRLEVRGLSMSQIRRISIDQFRINLQQGVPMFLIDARREDQWRESADTALSAVRIKLEEAPFRAGEVGPGRLAVVFCGCAQEESSTKVAEILRQSGCEARVLEGGYDAWKVSGLPLVAKTRNSSAGAA